MRAEWEDAPARVRSRKNNTPIIISIGISLCFLLGGAYWVEKQQILQLQSPSTAQNFSYKPPAKPTQQIGKTAGSANYKEQVNHALQTPSIVSADYETFVEPDTKENRQTVFNDYNYAPNKSVNSISMNTSRSKETHKSSIVHKKREPYVTVVKESRSNGCLFGKPGSTECRRVRSAVREHYNRECKFGKNSNDACKIARAYAP